MEIAKAKKRGSQELLLFHAVTIDDDGKIIAECEAYLPERKFDELKQWFKYDGVQDTCLTFYGEGFNIVKCNLGNGHVRHYFNITGCTVLMRPDLNHSEWRKLIETTLLKGINK